MDSLIDLQRLTGDYLWDFGANIILAVVILVVGRLVANPISGLTRRLLQRSGLEEILVNFSATITNALLTLVVIIAAVDRLGVDTTSLIALLGAAGIAVDLAQGTCPVLVAPLPDRSPAPGIAGAATCGRVRAPRLGLVRAQEWGVGRTGKKGGDAGRRASGGCERR